MPSRRKARELALQMLFQWDLGKHAPAEVLAGFLAPRKLDAETGGFAQKLFEGAVAEAATLDRAAAHHAENWRLERMAAVDRNILRLALYELFYLPEHPPTVVINEAIELARKFSSVNSVDFINGVLDAARKAGPAADG